MRKVPVLPIVLASAFVGLFMYLATRALPVQQITLPDRQTISARFVLPTIAELTAFPVDAIKDGKACVVLGFHATGDGGGGMFRYSSTSTAPADGGTVFAPAVGGGKWLRIYDGEISVKWFGAAGDGITDDTTAIRAAIKALGGDGRTVKFPRGRYKITNTVTISADRTHIVGAGIYATRILFQPPNSAACFSFTKGPDVLYQCSISNLALTGAGLVQKIGIQCVDTSEMAIDNIAVMTWSGGAAGRPSIGVQLKGREMTTLNKVSINADRPISVEKNPNNSIDCDHLHLSDTYLLTRGVGESGIMFESNIAVTSLTVSGYSAIVGGKYGIRFLGGVNCFYIDISDVRFEQPSDATGSTISFERTASGTYQNVRLSSLALGIGRKGVFLRGVQNATLTNLQYEDGSGVAWDIDKTCNQIAMISCFTQVGSREILNGISEAFSVGNGDGARGPSNYRFFIKDATPEKYIRIYGVKRKTKQMDVTAGTGGRTTIGPGINGKQKSAIITMSAYSAAGPINEGGIFSLTAQGIVMISGTANVSVGNVPNKLTLFYENSRTITVLNQLPRNPTVTVVLDIVWSE